MSPQDPGSLRSSAPWPSALGATLKARRHRLGLSQHDLALLAGVGVRLVHELEHGKGSARLDKVVAVLRVLGLQLRVETGHAGLSVSPDV